MDDLIRRQDVMDVVSCYIDLCNKALDSLSLGGRDRYAIETERNSLLHLKDDMKLLPSVQPEQPIYEVLTAEEVAKEVSATSLLSCIQWFEVFRRVSEMGYIICRKPE